jgi:hypothetical protein
MKRHRDEQHIKGTRGGVDEQGAQIVENVQTDTDKPVDSISGPHNSPDEESSLRRMNTCGSVYRYQRGRSLLPLSPGWSLGLNVSYPRKTNPKVS